MSFWEPVRACVCSNGLGKSLEEPRLDLEISRQQTMWYITFQGGWYSGLVMIYSSAQHSCVGRRLRRLGRQPGVLVFR